MRRRLQRPKRSLDPMIVNPIRKAMDKLSILIDRGAGDSPLQKAAQALITALDGLRDAYVPDVPILDRVKEALGRGADREEMFLILDWAEQGHEEEYDALMTDIIAAARAAKRTDMMLEATKRRATFREKNA